MNIYNVKSGGLEEIKLFCRRDQIDGRGAFLVPLNPIKVIKARSRPDFQEIIDNSDWVFPDAWGVKWAADFLYGRRIPVIPGYVVMLSLIEQAANDGVPIYLLGTTDEVLGIAAERLKKMYPGLRIGGMHNGFFSEGDEEHIFMEIAESRPGYVFVAMGEYKQEKVISRLRKSYAAGVLLGVGGSIDLVAGRQPSPPEWMRRNHLEWIFRLFRQPWRAPRFKALPIFACLVCLEKLKMIVTKNG